MNLKTFTIEGSKFQTSRTFNALLKAKEVAKTLKSKIKVYCDGKVHAIVSKNGVVTPC